MIISIIAAVAENGVIGKNNQLPWKLTSDLKRFRHFTQGKAVIMGRKTFESIGQPLKDRINIILTSDKTYKPEKTLVFNNLGDALNFAGDHNLEEVFIIGGSNLYQQTIELADRIYLTKVHAEVEGDTYFPYLNMDDWDIVDEEFIAKDEKNQYDSTFFLLEQ
jgi:dihydrofolate reductase